MGKRPLITEKHVTEALKAGRKYIDSFDAAAG